MEQDTRFELRLSKESKAMLNDLAADAGITAAEWLRQVIVDAWTSKQAHNAKPASDD